MKRPFLAVAALLALAAGSPAHAALFTYELDTTINGDMASGVPTATVEDIGADQVRLTLSLVGTPSAQFMDTWLFNFDGTQTELDNLTFTRNALSTGPVAADITISGILDGFGNNNTSGFGANSSGLFDIQFGFDSNGSGGGVHRFNGGEVLIYDISGTGLSASLFNVTSASPFNSDGPYYSAAHIQGIPGAQSGAMGANTSIPGVPEPSSLLMGVIAIAGLAGLSRSRANRSA